MWSRGFDFVFEAYTLQVLPASLRPRAIRGATSFVAPGGTLLVVARARDDGDGPGEMPWPLSRAELALAEDEGLELVSLEDYVDGEEPAARRFRAAFRLGGP